MRTLRNIILTIAVFAVAGIGVSAFARGGMGWGGGWDHYGRGMHYQDGYGYDGHMGMHYRDGCDYDNENQLSRDEYRQLEQQREAFFKETQDIRSKLIEKEQELQNELAKDNPDAAKASNIQKEISELQSQFDQKRIDHMVEMRKLAPNLGRGFMGGGTMMGYGPSGGGHCWE
jgi:Spy/CpxP family protein refolding chaperone